MKKVVDRRKSKVTPVAALPKKAYKKVVTEYKNKAGITFHKGDRVRLSPKALTLYKKTEGDTFAGRLIERTKVTNLLPDVAGMVVLERRLGGYWTWSVDDLEHVT